MLGMVRMSFDNFEISGKTGVRSRSYIILTTSCTAFPANCDDV